MNVFFLTSSLLLFQNLIYAKYFSGYLYPPPLRVSSRFGIRTHAFLGLFVKLRLALLLLRTILNYHPPPKTIHQFSKYYFTFVWSTSKNVEDCLPVILRGEDYWNQQNK